MSEQDIDPLDLSDRDAPGVVIDRRSDFWTDLANAVLSDRYAVPEGAGYTKRDLIDLIDNATEAARPVAGRGHRAIEATAENVTRLMVAAYIYGRQMDAAGLHDEAERFRDHADHLRHRLREEAGGFYDDLPDYATDFDAHDATEDARWRGGIEG